MWGRKELGYQDDRETKGRFNKGLMGGYHWEEEEGVREGARQTGGGGGRSGCDVGMR